MTQIGDTSAPNDLQHHRHAWKIGSFHKHDADEEDPNITTWLLSQSWLNDDVTDNREQKDSEDESMTTLECWWEKTHKVHKLKGFLVLWHHDSFCMKGFEEQTLRPFSSHDYFFIFTFVQWG